MYIVNRSAVSKIFKVLRTNHHKVLHPDTRNPIVKGADVSDTERKLQL